LEATSNGPILNHQQVLSKAEEAWTNIEAREELVNHLKARLVNCFLRVDG